MKFTIKGESKELYVQTVTLQPDDEGAIYPFHCPNCGNTIQKICGRVSKIYPFYEPSSQVAAITKCQVCKNEYTFQTHDGYSTDEVKVILHPQVDEDKNYFYCYLGKDLILEFTDTSIYSHVESKPKTVPFTTTCSKAYCPITYLIAEVI